MKQRGILVLIVCAVLGCGASLFHSNKKKEEITPPNIVIIVSDDQGYADVSFQDHPAEVNTPAIDQLAADGVVFTNAYVSAYVCAPSRAGLLTGRYQQRFGFYRSGNSRKGLPLSEVLISDLVKEKGYKTGVFGKWHVGIDSAYHPLRRGFDMFYGFLGHGAHDYFDLSCSSDFDPYNCIYRNDSLVNDSGYLTDNLGNEACSFIRKNTETENPFFLYLPFNAVHWPMQAVENDLGKFDTGDGGRDTLLAMTFRMDLAIGKVIETLKETGNYENTLIFFFSDNGGAKANNSNNSPLRDFKGTMYEGGLRVPYLMSWPKEIEAGICEEPIIALDILPTICAVLQIPLPENVEYDGKDLMPIIRKEGNQPLHSQLFWDGGKGAWAIREGDWKLVFDRKDSLSLFNLRDDIGESVNLIEDYPDRAQSMEKSYLKWRDEMGEPMGR